MGDGWKPVGPDATAAAPLPAGRPKNVPRARPAGLTVGEFLRQEQAMRSSGQGPRRITARTVRAMARRARRRRWRSLATVRASKRR